MRAFRPYPSPCWWVTEVVWSGAYGYANVGLKAPATTESLYNAASTLKPVTRDRGADPRRAGQARAGRSGQPISRGTSGHG